MVRSGIGQSTAKELARRGAHGMDGISLACSLCSVVLLELQMQNALHKAETACGHCITLWPI